MLVIRDEQQASIAHARDDERLRQLRVQALALLDVHWRHQLQNLSVIEKQALVERAFEHAWRVKFSSTYEIFTLLNSRVALGEDFGQDPRCAWARELEQFDIPAASRSAALANHVLLELRRRMGN